MVSSNGSPANLSSPLYEMPMEDSDILIIGKITLIWSQIDMGVETILRCVGRFEKDQFDHFFKNKTIMPKLEAIRIYSKKLNIPKRSAVITMCEVVARCNKERNLIMHGTWCWMKKGQIFTAGAYSMASKDFMPVTKLPSFYEQIVDASIKTDAAMFELLGIKPDPKARNRPPMTVADHDPGPNEPAPPRRFIR